MIERALGRVFDRVADAYDAARPGYPDGLFEALTELSGVRLPGALVVDVGAGTGISTRALLAHGARVVALDPGAGMLARLVARTDDTGTAGAVLADGNALPLRDGVADLVCYAQSWHWLDPVASIAEARRVLRRTGRVAAWWNTHDTARAEWLAAYEARLAELAPEYWGPAHPEWRVPSIAAVLDVEERWIPWTRLVGVEEFLLDLRSHSYMAALEPGRADELVGRQRELLREAATDGMLSVPVRVYLAVGA
ncbi:class I SAM-dependent methyltransferase [Nonomuraea sp. NPDC050310]|uniref:class I SAM-dependent methyltransferase n=1 Tax=unclassified Nonomuraea TaxID=2593643 RepID=UPI0033E42804